MAALRAVPRVEGLCAQQWSETVRTDEQWECMLFPRLFAVAERAWHVAEWELPYEKGMLHPSSLSRTNATSFRHMHNR